MGQIDESPPCAAIFSAWHGSWHVRRSLTSRLPGFPSGVFEGEATFTPSTAFAGNSYLYHETGTLTTDQGLQLIANRKFVFRHNPDANHLSVWFVKEEPDSQSDDVDYLYHDLEFQLEHNRWVARGDHLCNDDMYWSFYDFRFEDGSLSMWGQKHKVKGPEKDYSTDTVYRRK